MTKATNPAAILVVEDDPNIRFGLVELLTSEGFTVESCERGDEALPAIQKRPPNLVVLDIMLPGLSGYDVCKQLRSHGYTGLILMLTARGQELDKVIGLNLGADDYVTKPFGLRELTARVHALLRRSPQPQDTLTFADCTVDVKTFELRRGEKIVSLTAREVKLFQIFITHPNEVLSRDRLLSEAWGHEYYGTTRTLDQTVVQLRKKLADIGMDPKQIATVHGAGYRWVG
jgi:DNA-binding response OmpR family regulator